MPFFIPIMIGASVLSILPSFFGVDRQRAQDVIKQDGNNYFNRQTMRNGNKSFNHQMPRATGRNPYPKIELDPRNGKNGINIQQYLLYGALAVGGIILLKILLGRGR